MDPLKNPSFVALLGVGTPHLCYQVWEGWKSRSHLSAWLRTLSSSVAELAELACCDAGSEFVPHAPRSTAWPLHYVGVEPLLHVFAAGAENGETRSDGKHSGGAECLSPSTRRWCYCAFHRPLEVFNKQKYLLFFHECNFSTVPRSEPPQSTRRTSFWVPCILRMYYSSALNIAPPAPCGRGGQNVKQDRSRYLLHCECSA